jgi:hypothetical protein
MVQCFAEGRPSSFAVGLRGKCAGATPPLDQPRDARDTDTKLLGDLTLRTFVLIDRRRDALSKIHQIWCDYGLHSPLRLELQELLFSRVESFAHRFPGRRFVFVCDEYSYSTDPTFDVRRIVKTYTGHWNIEITFLETRSELHIHTPRGWSKPTVLRTVPSTFGLYTVVAMFYATLPKRRRVGGVSWSGRSVVTFSDALSAVSLWIRAEGVFAHAREDPSVRKRPHPIREILYAAPAPTA